MVEYKLDVQDTSNPNSRLVFLRSLEEFLMGLKDSGTIQGYSLSTPNAVTCIFNSETEA